MNVKPDSAAHHRNAGWVGHRLSLDVRDPTPFETEGDFWRGTAQAATVVMCVLMLGVLLYLARAVIVPLLCAAAVGLTLGPFLAWLQRRKIPEWLTATAVVLGLIAAINAAIVMLAGPASTLIQRAPELGAAFADKMHFFDAQLAALRELQTALGIDGANGKFEFSPANLVGATLAVVTPAALQFILQLVTFFATLFFIILGRSRFRKFAVNWSQSRTSRLRALKILNDIEDNLGGYLFVVTCINLGLGLVTTAATFAMGLPSPVVWGALAFVLNYVPYVGPAVMYVLLFVIGLLTYPTFLGALIPPAVFMAITLVEGQILTPAIVGRRVLNLHPLSVFLSIVFWAWLWGPVGAFLATPILIVFRVVLEHSYPGQRANLPG